MHPLESCDVTAQTLRDGGVTVQTMALFVGGGPKLSGIAKCFRKMWSQYDELLLQSGWKQIRDYRDAREEEPSFILSVEGCDLLENKLDLLHDWRNAGVRMAALTWNYENCIGTPAKIDNAAPLKPFGRETVKEMVRLGIAPDTSHLNERGFYDLLEMGVVPLASHSCCKALCGHCRNLTDDQLKALFQAGGYVGVNFYPYFLSDDGHATIETICRHVLHMIEMGGEKQIGFGSDFDGIECKPQDMNGPQDFPQLLNALRGHGLTEAQIEGLAGQNLMAYYDRIDPRT